MREIKFRAWSPIKKRYIDYNYKLGYEYDETDYLPCVFEESIGLKDKYGKEIYEGDIVEVLEYESNIPLYEAEVVFDQEDCMFALKTEDKQYTLIFGTSVFCDINCCQTRIIGNIHERN